MGYTTDFSGSFKLNKPLDEDTREYLTKFADSRRMKRNLPSVLDANGNVLQDFGVDGEFYVDGLGPFGQAPDSSIVDHNKPPRTQPGLWCGWVPNEDGTAIVWNQQEKFYYYIEWIKYIVTNFLAPKGYVLNGDVEWQGEESSDIGMIRIVDNKVTALYGHTVYAAENENIAVWVRTKRLTP
jgi:hypothetical protein